MPKVTIKTVEWGTNESLIKAIRIPVFVEEQNVPYDLDFDEFDPVASHWIAYSKNIYPVATVRLLADGHVGRMAVLKEHRRQGIGRMLILAVLDFAHETKMSKIFLHAQLPARAFYERVGFVAYGNVFVDANIDHIAMELSI
ncbi:MAG: GNAT family N-acetyltransferase [Proteobacteria bacterium]|jgi:predicted GNAT family N-acyltransferase|nr:GNAT family N-acetyltransferase [Pseudomonadota bacterium]MBT5065292.1 GNAT family N-acetyltransferase [Pseudomonadota bacterium]MBT6192537.1 GNAT family N-acetyltransferase [Pseudomonadota bacterium]MBT6465602.1 GNAT family N-acetyltransferase [Pseudomonadota bacterium]MBT7562323.1 GNAT family N-acetyltransferase [Pseudomonadota bacterium]